MKNKKTLLMIIGIIVAIVGIVLSIVGSVIGTQKYESDISTVEDSVVWIYSNLSTPVIEYEGSWSGTGFAIGTPGEKVSYIVTNAHVVKQAYAWTKGKDDPFDLEQTDGINLNTLLDEYDMTLDQLEMKSEIRVYYSEDSYDYDDAEVVYYSGTSEYDIAILKLDKPTSDVKPLLFSNTAPAIKEKTMSIGFPEQFKASLKADDFSHDYNDLVITEFGMLKYESLNGRNYRHIKLFDYYDNLEAYGPIINSKGDVVGIAVINEHNGPLTNTVSIDKNYALSSETLREILDAEGINYITPGLKNSNLLVLIFLGILVVIGGAVMIILSFVGKKTTTATASQTANTPLNNKPGSIPVVEVHSDSNNQPQSNTKSEIAPVSQAQQTSQTAAVPVAQTQQVNQQQIIENNLRSFVGKSYRGSSVMTATIFYKDHIQYGNRKYSYSDLTEITINRMPSGTYGSASTIYKPENTSLTITFYNDARGFVNAVEYANEVIEKTAGNYNGRNFLLKSPDGYKLEVFEDYITIKAQGAAQPMKGYGNSRIIMYQEITSLKTTNDNKLEIVFNNDGQLLQILISYLPSDVDLVNKIISYIDNHTTRELTVVDDEPWKLVTGTVREFPLLGRSLIVNEKWDVFNSYRTMYMNCAIVYSQQMKKKYFEQIYDFDTFMKLYVPLYQEQLEKLIKKTTDILVSAGIWTETSESIMQRHIENYHLAMDDYTTMLDSLLATVRNNKETVAAITSLVPNLVGFGFGVGGALKGIATATAFNLVRDGAEAALIDKMNIRPAQKIELYNRIKPQVLFERAFLDMWRVFLTLIDIMNENGKDIWRPTDDDSAKADNIMKNVSNPNFPMDQFPDVMVTVIGMNPYKKSIYELLLSRGADKTEVKAIREYFGYTERTPMCIT